MVYQDAQNVVVKSYVSPMVLLAYNAGMSLVVIQLLIKASLITGEYRGCRG